MTMPNPTLFWRGLRLYRRRLLWWPELVAELIPLEWQGNLWWLTGPKLKGKNLSCSLGRAKTVAEEEVTDHAK